MIGLSLEPPTTPSNFDACRLSELVTDVRGDVRDFEMISRVIERYQPQVVFHLAAAAQPEVVRRYGQPRETFNTNVLGVVNILEAVRNASCVRVVVCITSDKCYENKGWAWGYREIDQLGGLDPYSASKAMAEIAIGSYRDSFFPIDRFEDHRVSVASARAGNVIGGGDWAYGRLVPEIVRALSKDSPIKVSNPNLVRPWQYVLEPLSGYMWLAARMLDGQNGYKFAEPWNFGPSEMQGITVEEFVKAAILMWGKGSYEVDPQDPGLEAPNLRLAWDKAANRLNWQPTYTWQQALSESISWFKTWQQGPNMYDACVNCIQRYSERAVELNIEWSEE